MDGLLLQYMLISIVQCDEEFGKWEERKKFQANTDKLKTLLKEKSCQVDALRVNVDRLKETIIRLEKEKITLEGKLKSVKGNQYFVVFTVFCSPTH